MRWIGWIMKHLCCSKYILLFLLSSIALFASLNQKSALFYYGKNISYSMAGIHEYIVVEPKNINIYSHGFDVYKEKIYAHLVLTNGAKKAKKRALELLKKGYGGVYLDTSKESNSLDVTELINSIQSHYPYVKIMLNNTLKIERDSYELCRAIVLDDRSSISQKSIHQLQNSAVDIIKIAFLTSSELDEAKSYVQEIEDEGMIPYVTTRTFTLYGYSSKVAMKREIFTLIDERKEDRTLLGAHQVGALPMEYLGYIQKLYDINDGLPEIESMRHYAGVVIWLREDYKDPQKLVKWVLELGKIGVKVAFINNFGFSADAMLVKPLDIEIYDGDTSLKNRKKIIYQDEMIGFEMDPSLGESSIYIHPNNAQALLTYEDSHHMRSTPAAITEWGGYVIAEALMVELNDENVWVVNPFEFFKRALRLPTLAIPDTTTENGNRIFFTHVDGDGMVSRVESNPELFSGDMILEKILKVYKVPHSISLIGAEVEPSGLYPQFSQRVLEISKEMYALPNVEPATHTFTHPFYWGEIKNNSLAPEFRLKPPGYEFSFKHELTDTLEFINKNLLDKNSSAEAKTVFWSGDCSPRLNALDYIYTHGILNINGGDTTISNITPWLTLVAPIGLERGDYYQIYTGAQNENVFTNDWLGPFWGFKRVVQTFKLTNSPRRLKPIDIYYHLYSGSKTASLNALKYVFDWSLKQEIYPMYTSEYIPKAMDYFSASLAHEKNEWLVDGMRDLKTLRFEDLKKSIEIKDKKNIYGYKQFENHTYISLAKGMRHKVSLIKSQTKESYLINANAKVISFRVGKQTKRFEFQSFMDLNLKFHLEKGCKIESKPKAQSIKENKREYTLLYRDHKEARIDVVCR